VDNLISINKRGSLIIPKELVEQFGFNIDDAFEVRKSAAGLSLKKK
jgi:bifunctional DNA-binding transcriptional regulator/antitoxin component of YhaV-PrlF toxin-antitoxin module